MTKLAHCLICCLAWFAAIPLAAEIISADRRINWVPGVNVGVPGGIPARTTVYTTLEAGSTAAQINTAIGNCPAGQVVELGAGVFELTASISIGFGREVTLRGQGPTTILRAANNLTQFVFIGNDYSRQAARDITGGWTTGSTSLTVGSTAGLSAGDLIQVDQLNVAGLNWSRYADADSRDISQFTRITAINGTTLTIAPAIYYATSEAAPRLYHFLGGHTDFSGVEDMALDVDGYTVTYGVFIWQTYGCWVKNVSMAMINNYNITIGRSVYPEIAKCVMFDSPDHGPNHAGVLIGPTATNAGVSGALVYDNITHRIFPGIQVNSSSGNVIAYNFINDSFYTGFGQGVGILVNHRQHPMFNLVEGNVVNTIQNDGYYGSASHNTYFRNWAHGFVTDGLEGFASDYNSKPFALNRYSLYENLVGNVIGHSSITPTHYSVSVSSYGYEVPVIYQFGYPNSGNNTYTGTFDADEDAASTGDDQRRDLRVEATAIIEGNYDTYNDDQVWTITPETIASSLYLAEKPTWFGSLTWPAVDPAAGLSGLSFASIPAGYRYTYGEDPPTGEEPANVPDAPSGLIEGARSVTSVALTWTDNASGDAQETGFELEIATSQAGPFTLFSEPAQNATSATITGLAPDSYYYVRIRGVNATGNGLYSAIKQVSTRYGGEGVGGRAGAARGAAGGAGLW